MTKEVGLLWQIDPKLSQTANIVLAMVHHRERFGTPATVITMNPDDWKDEIIPSDEVLITRNVSCQKGHIFAGRKL